MSIEPGSFQPLPLRDERAAAARAEAEALLAQANKMHTEASGKSQRIVADAQAEAARIRATAAAESEARRKRDDSLDTWAARGIIAGTVGLTASGEYSLARMAGFGPEVAWLLPFVIDLYVIQAFRRHRDIVQAIALTVAANVTYHLADAGLFGVTARREPTWWLIALVASVASIILWRIHLMVRPAKAAKDRKGERQNDRQQQPAVATVQAPVTPPVQPSAAANSTASNDRQEPPTGGASNRQNEPAKTAPTGAKKPASTGRQNSAKPAAKKTASKRRSMDDWVRDAGPVFHDEFSRLRRNPTATEFATAIQKAGLGKVSDSTAKNIRAEILDRTPLPELDGTE